MRRVCLLVACAALITAADGPSERKAEPTPSLKLELVGQEARVEIRGRLLYRISSLRGAETTLDVGPVASFLLTSRDAGFEGKAKKLNGRDVVATGTVSLAETRDRRYVRGSFLGRRQTVKVTGIELAGD